MSLGIILVPLVGVIEVIAVGKAFGRRNGYKVDANQELLATGFSNILGSFVSAYPVTASFSRSAVNSQSGATTTIAGVVSGVLVLLALAVLTPLFYYIPDAALAAVIIMAVIEMVNFATVKHLWQISKPDLLPWFITFFVSLGAGFEYGILSGVAASLLVLLYPWARPPMTIAKYDIEKSAIAVDETANIIVINVSIGLMFPGIEHLQEKIMSKAFKKNHKSSVILDFTGIHRMDYTSALGIQQLTEDFARQRSWLVFVNVRQSVLDTLGRADVQITQVDSMENAVQLITSSSPPDDTFSRVIVRPVNSEAPQDRRQLDVVVP
jgi:sodium-independent sulfate anion transporter 11